ncbi:MAG: RsmB/NOP family class I SAM-dependent RNA methyltransferase [Calditrichaceae bacterium]
MNTLKTDRRYIVNLLNRLNVEYCELPFNSLGIMLKADKVPLSHTLDFFLGYFNYQGISSQIPALALDPQPGEKVLDIAAAPGSKSTQIAALMENRGELYLNDISKGRLQSLNVNVQRAGVLNEIILNMAGERFGTLFAEYFDKILVDAPCTALGTLPGSPEVAGWWSYHKLEKLCVSQKQMLISALKALKPGGELVYSTCSIAPEENEALIQWLLDNYPVKILKIPLKKHISCDDGLTNYNGQSFDREMAGAIKIYPHEHGMEGFFVIKLKKHGSIGKKDKSVTVSFIPTLHYNEDEIKNELNSISDLWGINHSVWKDFRFIKTSQRIWMMCRKIKQVPAQRLHNAGILLAERRLSGWKLTNQSAQYLNGEINHRKIELTDKQLISFFADGSMKITGLEYGYYVLERESKAVATLYSANGQIKIRLPHVFRLAV